MSGGGGTNTTTSTSGPPQQVLSAYSNLLSQANNVASTPYQPYTGNLVAPLSPDQNAGITATQNAQGAAAPYINAAAQEIGQSTTPIWNNVQQFSPDTISKYESPYTSDVVNATQAEFNNQNQQQQQGIAGNATQNGAWGGDRSAVAQGIVAGQEQLAQAPVIAGLQNQGYAQALNEFNQQQGAQIGANEANNWLASQAGAGLSNLGSQAQNTQLQGAQALLGVGGLEQQQAQQSLNIPYEQYTAAQAYPFQTTGWLGNLTEGLGGASGGSSSTTAPGPSTASQVGGGLLAGAGILGQTGAFGNAANNYSGWLTGLFGAADGGAIPKRAGGGGIVPDVSVSFIPGATGMGAAPSNHGSGFGLGSMNTNTSTTKGGGGDGGIGSALGTLGTVAQIAALAARGGVIPHRASGGNVFPMMPHLQPRVGPGFHPANSNRPMPFHMPRLASGGSFTSANGVEIPILGGGGITAGSQPVSDYLAAVASTASHVMPQIYHPPAPPAAPTPTPAPDTPAIPVPGSVFRNDIGNGGGGNGQQGGGGGGIAGGGQASYGNSNYDRFPGIGQISSDIGNSIRNAMGYDAGGISPSGDYGPGSQSRGGWSSGAASGMDSMGGDHNSPGGGGDKGGPGGGDSSKGHGSDHGAMGGAARGGIIEFPRQHRAPGGGIVDDLSPAILDQESGNNPNAPTSVAGAVGPGQIMPETFRQYAKPGERIDNPQDNVAVSHRILTDYSQRYGNDPARMAAAYFSGPGNVAPPGSATPWIKDAKDGYGKSVSSYVGDIQGRLGKNGPPAEGGITPDMPEQQNATIQTDGDQGGIATPQYTPVHVGSDPWKQLLYAGLGIMGGNSPHALTNIGRGAEQGLTLAERERQTQEQEQNTEAFRGFQAQAKTVDEKHAAMQLAQQADEFKQRMAKADKDRTTMTPYQEQELELQRKKLEAENPSWATPNSAGPSTPSGTTPARPDTGGQDPANADNPDQLKIAATDADGKPYQAALPTPKGNEDFLKTLPPNIATQVKAIAEGRMTLPNGFALSKKHWQDLLGAVSQYDPSFDASNASTRAKTRAAFTSGQPALLVTSLNRALGHMAQLKDAGDRMNNGDFVPWNELANWTQTKLGGSNENNFNLAKLAVSDELEKAFRGTGTSVTGIREWQKALTPGMSPEQQQGAWRTMTDLLNSQIDALGEQYGRGMGVSTDGFTLLGPNAQAAYKHIRGTAPDVVTYDQRGRPTSSQSSAADALPKGVPPGSLFSPSRGQYKGPDGTIYAKDGTPIEFPYRGNGQ